MVYDMITKLDEYIGRNVICLSLPGNQFGGEKQPLNAYLKPSTQGRWPLGGGTLIKYSS